MFTLLMVATAFIVGLVAGAALGKGYLNEQLIKVKAYLSKLLDRIYL